MLIAVPLAKQHQLPSYGWGGGEDNEPDVLRENGQPNKAFKSRMSELILH